MPKRFLKSTTYAFNGMKKAWQSGRNFRIQCVVALLMLLLAWFFALSFLEWMFVLLCISLVLSAEMMNTAMEKLTDQVFPRWDEKAGFIKDLAAGAVLIISIFSAIIGMLIFLPKILHY